MRRDGAKLGTLAMTAARLAILWESLGPRYGDGDLFVLKLLDRHRVQGKDPTTTPIALC
jgi:hypothetical protein